MNQRDTDFFRPLWLRIAVTLAVAIWFGLEALLSRDQLWMTITGVALAYCVWSFFIRYPKGPAEPPKP
jgi:hypothetical protein